MRKVLVKLDSHPYFTDVWFTNSRALYAQQVSKIRQDPAALDIDDLAGVVSSNDSRSQMVVGVFVGDSYVLVHELSHAVINVFYAIGMDANTWTTEAFAYLMESFYRQCTDHLNAWSVSNA